MERRRVLQHMTVEQNLIIGGHMFPSAQAMRQAMDSVYEAIPRLAELRKRRPAICQAASSRCW